jgi:heterodisulfide reductase subunit A
VKDPGKKRRIGLFFCRCGGNISDVVNLDQLCKVGSDLEDVEFSMWNSFTCSAEGQAKIREKIKEHDLDGIIIGSCTPRQYEEMFRETIAEAGLNPYMLEMINLREQCSYPHQKEPVRATKKAELLMKAAVEKARRLIPLVVKKAKVSKDIAVIGAGIAGIHASSTLAKLGYDVHLIEREPTVGGNMARVVKTFPTDDCAMCTLSPKMDEMTKNKKIHLTTYTEVKDIEKIKEGLKITLKRKPRYLDEEKCTGCGKCTEECPANVYNDYNLGLESTRKAVYKPFPAAVPNKFVIEKRGIPPCRSKCPVHQNAQGYVTLIAAGKYKEALDVIRRDNPLPSVCGRVCNHVCEDNCSRLDEDGSVAIRKLKRFVMEHPVNQDMEPPKIDKKLSNKVAVVGAGPSGLACAHDLALNGFNVTVYESSTKAGGVLAYTLPKYRLPRKLLERDIDYIIKLGVEIKTSEDIKGAELQKLMGEYDAVYMAIGLHKDKMLRLPGHDLPGVMLGGKFLKSTTDGKSPDLGNKVVVIGGGNVAFDVARSALRMGVANVEMICLEAEDEMPALPDEVEEAIEEGIKINNRFSPKKFIEKNGRVAGIECVKVEKIEFDDLGRIKPVIVDGSETVLNADTVIFAIGQAPNVESFSNNLSIEITSRGTIAADPETLKTNIAKLYAGGDAVSGPSTVVQAMAQGKLAARSIAKDLGNEIEDLDVFGNLDEVNKEDAIEMAKKAGHKSEPVVNAPNAPAETRIKNFEPFEPNLTEDQATTEAKRCMQCGGCCDCRVCNSVCEAECIKYDQTEVDEEITVGGIVVATGFKEYDPSKLHYGYGKMANVVTQFQLARMMDPIGPTEGKILRPSDGKEAKKIVMVQCAGSRGDGQGNKNMHSYCSRVCCMVALKHAGLIKKSFVSDAQIYICYIDIRAFGKGYEEYFERVKGQGVKFIKGLPAKVHEDKATKEINVTVEDALTDSLLNIDADLVVLSAATEPSEGITELIKQLNISKDEYGFAREFHPKIRPTDSTVKNIMIAGSVQSPKDITDTIAQAGSAAASIAGYIGDGYITLNPMIAYVDETKCRACGRCEEFCEFKAVKVGEKFHAEVEEVMCEGCGKCSAICPTGAITVYSSNNEQVEAMIDALREG